VITPEGKGANQAVACARLGAEMTLAGRVGKDVFGQIIIKNLKRENINIKYVASPCLPPDSRNPHEQRIKFFIWHYKIQKTASVLYIKD